MNRLIAEGDRVYIEFCIRCEQHQWCTQHSSSKYLSYFNLCKTELLRYRSDLKIYPNEIPPKLVAKFHPQPDSDKKVVPGKLNFPRIGAFEVYYRGVLVFSKLASGLWPRPEIVCENVRKVEEEQARKEQEKEKKHGKRTKSRKRKRRKKSGTAGSARTSPSRTLKSSQEPFTHSSNRPQTSKPRTRSSKRSRSPISQKEYPDSSSEFSRPRAYKSSFSSEESVKQYHDEGIQADRFEIGFRDIAVDLEDRSAHRESVEKSEEAFVSPQVATFQKPAEERKVDEPDKVVFDRPKTAKRPVENPVPQPVARPEQSSYPQVLQINPPAATAVLEISPPAATAVPLVQEVAPLVSVPAQIRQAVPPPLIQPPPPPLQTKATTEVRKSPPHSDSADEKQHEASKGRDEDEDEGYGSGEFEDEGEEKDPEHPLRPVTKSYNVEIPMGKYTNKKITYENESGQDATFSLISSHPEEMHIKDSELTIAVNQKSALKVQFNPVYEECEKRFYLYLDKDDEPWECFEFIVSFT